jgi:hypothetical protein
VSNGLYLIINPFKEREMGMKVILILIGTGLVCAGLFAVDGWKAIVAIIIGVVIMFFGILGNYDDLL